MQTRQTKPPLNLNNMREGGNLLGAERKGCAGNGCGEVETFGDLSPDLLVNDLHQASLLRHQRV